MSEFRPENGSALDVPTIAEFDLLRDIFLQLGEESDAIVRARPAEKALFIIIERLYANLEFLSWPLLTINVGGSLKSICGGQGLAIRYRELSHNATTENSALVHDYTFTTQGGELVEFGQSIRAAPVLPEPRQEAWHRDAVLDQADRGRAILREATGGSLEPTAGDCDILFDRLAQFTSTFRRDN